MPDEDDGLVEPIEGAPNPSCVVMEVGERPRIVTAPREVDRDGRDAPVGQGRDDRLPAPCAVPGSVDEKHRLGPHGLILPEAVAPQCAVPIPAAPIGGSDVASTVLTLFEQLHDQVREEIEGLDDVGVNWSPGPGANSIATIVTHMVGSEAETMRCVAGVPCTRDREGEFSRGKRGVGEVVDELRSADELIAVLRPQIGSQRLRTVMTLPSLDSLPAVERRSGLTWLVGNYGHAREHVGHIQLTTQVYRTAAGRQVRPG
jgi:hypothetical protein